MIRRREVPDDEHLEPLSDILIIAVSIALSYICVVLAAAALVWAVTPISFAESIVVAAVPAMVGWWIVADFLRK